jgi:hypothetical protein
VCGSSAVTYSEFPEAARLRSRDDPSIRRRTVILGGGTGGTIMANRLRHVWSVEEAEITVVDRDDAQLYQPGLLFV